jgi:hypothetical protein
MSAAASRVWQKKMSDSPNGETILLFRLLEFRKNLVLQKFLAMKKLIIILCVSAIAGSAFAIHVKSYRVHFSIYGRRHATIVQAITPQDARDHVRHMHPGAVVTNVVPVR